MSTEAPTRRTVIGTAGHIDHGKTSLVRALTGIDCDRWQEEKDRGITIDLGFAWMREGDLQIGLVDVPGHEKFLHNALAGLGGIGLVLLVVAADEGVKPQTREHLDICRLLGIPRAVVALTKADLVSDDLLELAELEVVELLAETPWAEAPRFAVSSTTGEGVEALRTALLDVAGEAADAAAAMAAGERGADSGPARLPIDRSFHLKGLGVLVTGTLAAGRIAVGDTLELLPLGGQLRVRGIQVHGEDRDQAHAGERTSLQLAGADLEDLSRGLELVTPDRFPLARRLLGRFTLLDDAPNPLEGYQEVRVHVHAADVMGRLRPLGGEPLAPGESGWVEIRLAAPVVAVRGDRFIVRRPSPPATLGGGTIADPDYRPGGGGKRGGGSSAARLDRAFGGGREEAFLAWVEGSGEGGATAADLARRLGVEPGPVAATLAALADAGRLLEVGTGQASPAAERRFVVPATFRGISQRAARVLGEYFREHRLARGMPKAEAVRRILPGSGRGSGADLATVYLGWLEAQGVLSVDGDRVNLPGREADLTGRESELAKSLVAAYDEAGLGAPAPAEMSRRLEAKPQIVDGLVTYLVEQGKLVRLPQGLLVARSAVDRLRADLAASGWERFTVAQFKARFDLSRKWAIPLLEHLDSTGTTRRLGDERQVVADDAG